MEIALAVLLVSSLTSVGLLSLWVATSRRHRFLRTLVFVSVLSLLLSIPAYGPLAAFVWQGCVIVVCVRLVRWTKGSGSIKPYQFSLATLLRLMTLTAVAFTVAIKVDFEALDPNASQTVFFIGLGGGIATLIGYWMVRNQGRRLWQRIVRGLMCSVFLGLFFASGDWFILSLLTNGKGTPADFAGALEFYEFRPDEEINKADLNIWMAVSIATPLLIALFVSLVAHAVSVTQSRRQRYSAYSLFVLAAVLLSPLIGVCYQLITPLPIPVQKLPVDNGYDNLLAASKITEFGSFSISYDCKNYSNEKLRIKVEEISSAYEQLQIALTKEIRIPIDYRSVDTYKSALMSDIESASRSLAARGLLAVREGRTEAALQDFLDVIRIGNAIRQQALDCHWTASMLENWVGYSEIYRIRYELDREQLNETCALLQQLESEWDAPEEIAYRTRIWEQYAIGWFGHLTQILSEFNPPEEVLWSLGYERVQSRLLCSELAIIAFGLEHEHLPERLEELVPKYLPGVPSDPFSPNDEPLQYRREGETYVLYSVADNGVNNGGIPTPVLISGPGDYLLKDLFAPYTSAVVTEDE